MRRAASATVALLSATAAACSSCTDANVTQLGWWTAAAYALLLVGLTDALYDAVSRPPLTSGHGWRIGAAVLLVFVGVGLGAGVRLSCAAASMLLIAPRVWGAVRTSPGTPVHRRQVALILLAVAVLTLNAAPSRWTDAQLINVLLARPHLPPEVRATNWMERELQQRPGAGGLLTETLAKARAEGGKFAPARREVNALWLHALVGGDVTVRRPSCVAWREQLPQVGTTERRQFELLCADERS